MVKEEDIVDLERSFSNVSSQQSKVKCVLTTFSHSLLFLPMLDPVRLELQTSLPIQLDIREWLDINNSIDGSDLWAGFLGSKACALKAASTIFSLLETAATAMARRLPLHHQALIGRGHKVRLEPFLPEQL